MDLDSLEVKGLKDDVMQFGYSKEGITQIYFSRPNVAFKESLVPNEGDKEVREILDLCETEDHVALYVDHGDGLEEGFWRGRGQWT